MQETDIQLEGGARLYLFDGAVELSVKELEIIPRLIGSAALARTNPDQSGFHVRSAIIDDNGEVFTGGNREYAFSDAWLHGEEAALAHAINASEGNSFKGLGFYYPVDDAEQLTLSSCGNCRDKLLKETSPDLLMVHGDENMVLAARLENYLFDVNTLEEVDLSDDPYIRNVLNRSVKAKCHAVDVFLPEALKDKAYTVAVVGEGGNMAVAGLQVSAGYDATSPGVVASIMYQNLSSKRIESIYVVGHSKTGNLPDVLYRDRNYLGELIAVINGSDEAVPVKLVNADEKLVIQKAAETTLNEMIPQMFTSAKLDL